MVRKILWGLGILAAAFVVLLIARVPYVLEAQKTAEAVAKIHATKLTLDDVLGKNLPPDPGAEADKTIEGVDANQNGIRDDVELAIFNKYPNSAKTRAALLQYALALQMEFTQPIVNSGTVGAVANKEDAAFFCVARLISGPKGVDESASLTAIDKYDKFLANLQTNTQERKTTSHNFYEHLESGSIGKTSCDIDLNSFAN